VNAIVRLFKNLSKSSEHMTFANLKSQFLSVLLAIPLVTAQTANAASDAEVKKLTSGWSVDVKTGATKAAPSKTGSTKINGAGTTLGVSTNSIATERRIEGSVRLSNGADSSREAVVQVRWIGKDAKTKALVLIKEESLTLSVPTGKEVTFSSGSGEVQMKDTSLSGRSLGIQGTLVAGWNVVVREKISSAIIFSKASSSEFEKYAKSTSGLVIPE
jgi:hypothetical protein